MTTLFLITSIVLFIIILVLIWIIFNLLKKAEAAEDILVSYMEYLNNISDIIEISNEKIKKIDEREIFKSDDEIGFFFQNIKAIQEILNNFIVKKL